MTSTGKVETMETKGKVKASSTEPRARFQFIMALAALDVEGFGWFAASLMAGPEMVPPVVKVWPDGEVHRYVAVSEAAKEYALAAAPHGPAWFALMTAIAELPVEGLAWIARACPASAMMTGGMCQIWPDGLGGFSDRDGIEAVRACAVEYLGAIGK